MYSITLLTTLARLSIDADEAAWRAQPYSAWREHGPPPFSVTIRSTSRLMGQAFAHCSTPSYALSDISKCFIGDGEGDTRTAAVGSAPPPSRSWHTSLLLPVPGVAAAGMRAIRPHSSTSWLAKQS